MVVGQVIGEFEEKDGRMASYMMKVRDLQRGFTSFRITKVPRRDNGRADALSKLASKNPKNLSSTMSVQVLRQPNIVLIADLAGMERENSWLDPLVDYLVENKLPDDASEARRLKVRAASFTMIDGQLYKRGFTMPYLKCLRPTEAQEVLLEIHSGICGNHQGATIPHFQSSPPGVLLPHGKGGYQKISKEV